MSLANKVSSWNRKRKLDLFMSLVQQTDKTTILDCGFDEQEFDERDNFLEKHYPYITQITALVIAPPEEYLYARKDSNFQVSEALIQAKRKELAARYPQLKVVSYDGSIFPFTNQSFDVCWSNAVLEHVGDEEQQILFLKEIKRVGKAAFVTTPNKYFPVEMHTHISLLHFLPKKVFDYFLRSIEKTWATGDYMRLLSFQDVQRLLHAAGITEYRIIKNRLLFFVLDFAIVFRTSAGEQRA